MATHWDAWAGGAAVQTTNDAYLAADLTPMSARVAGIVRGVPIQDFQAVRRGDLLARIASGRETAGMRQGRPTSTPLLGLARPRWSHVGIAARAPIRVGP